MPTAKNETPKIINLSGPLTVERAVSLKTELLAALAGKGPLLISLSLVEDLDLACLQVIYAARKSAAASGKDFHFIGSVPSRIVKRLQAAGFVHGAPERAEDFEAELVDF